MSANLHLFFRAHVLVLLLFAFASPSAQAQPADTIVPPKRIGIVLDGHSPRGGELLAAAKRELVAFAGDGKVLFAKSDTLSGDWTAATASRNLQKLMADPEIDLVWAFGMLASDAAARLSVVDKPLVAPFVLDEKLQGIKRGATPGHLSYVLWSPNIRRDLKALQEFGDIRRVAFLVNAPLRSALPKLAKHAESEARALGIDLRIVPIGADVAKALAAIPADVDAAYLGPNPQLSHAEIEALAAGFVARKLPSFSYLGRSEVGRGLLVGLGSPDDGKRMARLIALNSDAMLRGQSGAKLTTAFKMEERLVINTKTARALGLPIAWELSSEATLLEAHQPRAKRRLTLQRVAKDVLARNLDLLANAEGVQAAEESVDEARAALLPRLDASLNGSWIDPDGTTARTPERSMVWSATASQALFDEGSWSRFGVQQHVRDAAKYGNASRRLDAVHIATVTYLNVLLAKSAERIQEQNLLTTREHLALARVRVKLGTGRKSEVLRFEAGLATNRKDVLTSVANRNIAEIELNRLLNRPLEERFEVADVSLDDSQLMSGGTRLAHYMTDEKRFRVLRGFLVEEGLRNAPELKSFGAQIAAKRREATSAKLAPFLPSLRASATVSHRFLEGGAGTEPTAMTLFDPNKFNWQAGITASLPLYQGNARYARTRRAKAESRQLEIQQRSSKQVIGKNILTTLRQAGAAFRAIRLTKQASNLAKENMKLVADAYAQGHANITEVLDAQSQDVAADFSAKTAIYAFLIELMNVQRATGRFEFAMGREDVVAFFSRLAAHEKRDARRKGSR